MQSAVHPRRARTGLAIVATLVWTAAAAATTACPADLDGNGEVGVSDLLEVLTAWGPCPGCPEDLDGNGEVEFEDLLLVLTAWGPCPLSDVTTVDLAGHPLTAYPFFDFVRAFNAGSRVTVAIDPRHLEGETPTCDLFVVAARSGAEWVADRSLVDVRGAPQRETLAGQTIQDNTFVLAASEGLSGDAGLDLGVGYDVVCDCNGNGVLDGGDFIDGLGDEAGLYVVHDVTLPGPLEVTEATYVVPNWPGTPGYGQENTFYPTGIGALGRLPLVVMGRGNGHDYQWYDHLGRHLASYGYVFMSHNNNTEPGVFAASTTTLQHTDQFLAELDAIADGVLAGHIDTSRIVWMGHSRGGEGVVVAYDRIFDGDWTPVNYSIDDLVLISSIAPADFLRGDRTDPHEVPTHVWTAGGDADLTGCANCNLCQTFHVHDRAQQFRQSISLYGVGHGNFHNGGGNPFFLGPCPIGTANTHQIMRGYLLPLVEHYVEGNVPARDFLTRQWESFRPIGAPVSECVVVDLMYQQGSAAGKFVIDDYQSGPEPDVSSSGGRATYTVEGLIEDRLDDGNTSFTTGSDTMNGMTVGGTGDDTRGVAFEWGADAFYELEVIEAERDLTGGVFLSFRACQETRHPRTTAALEDLTFTVTLRDGAGTTSRIGIGAYGGGIEEPYQRTACGLGTGWANEFETIRIRLGDFLNNGSGLDLANVVAVRFDFGPSWGSAQGRIGLDEIEVTRD